MNCNGLRLLQRITMGLTIALSSRSTFAQEEIWKARGDQANQGLGNIFDSVGDLTGDGIPDLVACGSGLARVLSGVDGSTVYSIYGTPTDGFGGSLAVLGDVDGDGVSDFAVGASGVDNSLTNQGAVFVYSGQTGALIYSVYGGGIYDGLGFALAALGDLNADGIGDFAVGSRANYALVLSGVDGSLIWTLTSPTRPFSFGESLGGGGDVDADGVPDVVVGDIHSWYGIKNGGAACVFSGATGALLHEFGSTWVDAYFGYSVTIPGDVDLDGFADVLIGAPADDRLLVGGGGYAAVYSGKDGTILMSFLPYDTGGLPRSWGMGYCVGGAGDTNDDGYPDLLIGANGFNADYVLRTATFLYSGRDGGLLYHFLPDGPSSWVGYALARAGDLDGDGLPDFAFGAWFEDNGSLKYAGSVSTWRGHKFFVDTLPHNAHAWDPVTMLIGQGVAGNPYALFLRGVNGTPTFVLLSLGALDAAGRSSLSTTIPPGFGFISLDLQAFTLDANGKLVPSNVVTFTTQ